MTIFGAGRGAITRTKAAGGGGGVTTPSILGTVSTEVNSIVPHTSDTLAHTVTAGTEVVLLIVLYGPNSNTCVEATPTSNVDGAFASLDAPAFGGSTLARPRTGVWALEAPTAGAHVVTYGVSAADLQYSAAVAINLDDVDQADIFGDLENIEVHGTIANTVSSALTTEKADSLIIAWAAAQGSDTAPFSEDLGLSQIVEFQTNGGVSSDAAMSVATKVGPASPGATTYGFSWSASDDYCYGAIEIRGAG